MGLLVIVYIPLRIFLLGSFVNLERQMLLTDLDRASNAIIDDTHNLDLLNARAIASYSIVVEMEGQPSLHAFFTSSLENMA